jgi:adenylate kinase family enzyme
MQRIAVVGNSGSGKSTLAAALARGMAAPHLELDSVFHQPGWKPLPLAEFRARVGEFAAGDSWVVDGNYSPVQDLVWQRADTVVWLDLSRLRVMRRLVGRTLRRLVMRAELWNGNRESWASVLRADPNSSIIAWAWTQHNACRQRYARAAADPANARLTFVRLQTPGQVKELIRRAEAQAAAGQDGRQDGRQGGRQEPGEMARKPGGATGE